MSRTRLTVALAAATSLGSLAAAHAATPSSGTVSNASPSVTWTGLLVQGAASYNAFNNNPDAPCAPGSCDTFALKVEDGGPLTLACELQRSASSGVAECGFRVTDPSGTTTFTGGPSGPDKPFTLKIKNAVKGDWTVDTTDTFVGTPGNYEATATLGNATPAPVVPTTPVGSPSPQPAAPGTTLAITTRSASSKKLRKARKLAVGLKSSAPVDNITVTLRKGKKKLASAKLATLASSGKATLKLKGKAAKLKKGSYRLVAAGTDKQNRPVSTATTLKVKR